jgi:flagellar biosynthesis protein FlhB
MNVRQLFPWTISIRYEVFIRVAFLLIVVAFGDYCFHKYRLMKKLKK